MFVTAIWIALLIEGFLIEIVGRLRPNRVSTFNRAAAMIERRTAGRAMLILLWVFIGFHLFARYTIPRK
jgi:hypothetical protein